jgi:hypothetical protein
MGIIYIHKTLNTHIVSMQVILTAATHFKSPLCFLENLPDAGFFGANISLKEVASTSPDSLLDLSCPGSKASTYSFFALVSSLSVVFSSRPNRSSW